MADDQHRNVETVAPPPALEPQTPAHRPAAPKAQRAVLDPTLVVPLVDQQEAGRIYDPTILRFAAVGGLLGALVLGVAAWLVGSGSLPVAGFGQFSAAGAGVATFTGSGLGLALGALVGALVALGRPPARAPALGEPRHG